MMSLFYYGSHQLFLCKDTLDKMINSTDYAQYKAIIVKQLKLTL